MDTKLTTNIPSKIHPQKFLMLVYLVSTTMLFAGLTSAYLVRQGAGNWLEFSMPTVFWLNTVIILLSSGSMWYAMQAAKKDDYPKLLAGLWITTLLAIVFVAGQWIGWQKLTKMNVFLVGNPSGSFFYVITGLHAFHLVAGIITLVFQLVRAARYKITSKNLLGLELCSMYWHYLDLLWIYLFVFLLVNHGII
ncbi:MAG: cytochrome c oxidase subunit 3 [Bacteroidia bacterium]|nr:cytochrome c oxidase subunit 3 [Bacteroidia bacterium]